MKREKRLKKGIESMEKQIEKHILKKEKALSDNKIELADYFDGEIESMEKRKKDRLTKVHRKDDNYNEKEDGKNG
ncbi:MAG: hypothetical protein AABX85_02425 [Nanoarchaeota archaeon]